MRLDRVMADRKISSTELAERVGITPVALSRIKQGHLKGIRFSTLEGLCEELACGPGDLMEFVSQTDYDSLYHRDAAAGC